MGLEQAYLKERVAQQDVQIEDMRIELRIMKNDLHQAQIQLAECEKTIKEYQELCQRHRIPPPLTASRNPTVTNPPPTNSSES